MGRVGVVGWVGVGGGGGGDGRAWVAAWLDEGPGLEERKPCRKQALTEPHLCSS